MSDYSAAANTPLVQRMIGAAMLNVNTYEEVEADSGATGQAATVVAIVAVASAIGAYQAGVITMNGNTVTINTAVQGAVMYTVTVANVTRAGDAEPLVAAAIRASSMKANPIALEPYELHEVLASAF